MTFISPSITPAFVAGSANTSCKGTKLEFVVLSSLLFSVDSNGFNWLEFAGGAGIFGSVDSKGFVLSGGGGGGTNCSTSASDDDEGEESNGSNAEGGGGGGGGKSPISDWLPGIGFCLGVAGRGLSSKGLNEDGTAGGSGKSLSSDGLVLVGSSAKGSNEGTESFVGGEDGGRLLSVGISADGNSVGTLLFKFGLSAVGSGSEGRTGGGGGGICGSLACSFFGKSFF
jgi:hypothetical protein